MSIKIVSDSASNLLALRAAECAAAPVKMRVGERVCPDIDMDCVEYAVVPLKILVEEREFCDDGRLDLAEMDQTLEKSSSAGSTSCPSPWDWLQAFGDADEVFCITLSSAMSGSYSSARIAKREYERNHPGCRVYLLDSCTVGPEMALIIEQLHQLLSSGMPATYAYRSILRYMERTHLIFSLEKLDRFVKNGRVPGAVAKGIGVLGIRLLGQASEAGEFQVNGKCRGPKQTAAALLKKLEELNYCGGKVLIGYHGDESEALSLMRQIRERFGAVDVRLQPMGGLCSYYAGAGSLLLGVEC